LETALDDDIPLANEQLRAELAQLWNGDSTLRQRLEHAVETKAAKRRQGVEQGLAQREAADIKRAQGIYAAFRQNLTESRERMHRIWQQESETLFALDPDASRQFRRDIAAMDERLANLDDEERTELASIRDRYADVQPFVSTAAVVFALTPHDAKEGALS